jgi:hypothetical protein
MCDASTVLGNAEAYGAAAVEIAGIMMRQSLVGAEGMGWLRLNSSAFI